MIYFIKYRNTSKSFAIVKRNKQVRGRIRNAGYNINLAKKLQGSLVSAIETMQRVKYIIQLHRLIRRKIMRIILK
jgi:phage terminase large subunit